MAVAHSGRAPASRRKNSEGAAIEMVSCHRVDWTKVGRATGSEHQNRRQGKAGKVGRPFCRDAGGCSANGLVAVSDGGDQEMLKKDE